MLERNDPILSFRLVYNTDIHVHVGILISKTIALMGVSLYNNQPAPSLPVTVPPLSCLVCLVDLPVFSSFAFLHCPHALLSIETHELN